MPLEESYYPPPALIGLPESFFVSDLTVHGIDWDVVDVFRNKLYPSPFRFVLFYRPMSHQIVDHLSELGVYFTQIVPVHIGNRASEHNSEEAISCLDFLFMDSYLRYLHKGAQDKIIDCRKESFLACLAHWSVASSPYSKQNFREVLERLTHGQ